MMNAATDVTMREPPLVSVVIPCYNQAHYLSEAIESVRQQTYASIEIVVVDDGSPDETAEVAARYPEVRCVRQNNRGLAEARNTGIRESRGELLVFLDADDRLLPNALATGVRCLTGHPECTLVYGRHVHITTDGAYHSMPSAPNHREEDYSALLRWNFIGMHGAVMYRRTVFEQVGTFDPSLGVCEDYDLYLRIARRFPFWFENEVFAEYRKHDVSMSHNHGFMLKTVLQMLRTQRAYFANDARLEEALRDGLRRHQEYYGELLVEGLRARMRARRGGRQVFGDALMLFWHHPHGFALHAYRKMRCTVLRA